MKTKLVTAAVLVSALLMAAAAPAPGLEKRGLRLLWRVRGGVNQMIRHRLYLLRIVKVRKVKPRRQGKRADDDEESLVGLGFLPEPDNSPQLPENLD